MNEFQQYLWWKRNPKMAKKEDSWHRVNFGRGVPTSEGKNFKKRIAREAHRIDRLAQIRAFRLDSDAHVPKLKRIPAEVFE